MVEVLVGGNDLLPERQRLAAECLSFIRFAEHQVEISHSIERSRYVGLSLCFRELVGARRFQNLLGKGERLGIPSKRCSELAVRGFESADGHVTRMDVHYGQV